RRDRRDLLHRGLEQHAAAADPRLHPPRAATARRERNRIRHDSPDGHPRHPRAAPDARHRGPPPGHRRDLRSEAMSATKTAYKSLVGGEFVDSISGETMEVIAPATGDVIAEVPRCTAEDVDRAVDAANKVLPEWLEKTPKERSELLHRLADV